MPEDHYLPLYQLMAKEGHTDPDCPTEAGTHGPHSLYSLTISLIRKHPALLEPTAGATRPTTCASFGSCYHDPCVHARTERAPCQLPATVLADVMRKPLGCVTRLLEVGLPHFRNRVDDALTERTGAGEGCHTTSALGHG